MLHHHLQEKSLLSNKYLEGIRHNSKIWLFMLQVLTERIHSFDLLPCTAWTSKNSLGWCSVVEQAFALLLLSSPCTVQLIIINQKNNRKIIQIGSISWVVSRRSIAVYATKTIINEPWNSIWLLDSSKKPIFQTLENFFLPCFFPMWYGNTSIWWLDINHLPIYILDAIGR